MSLLQKIEEKRNRQIKKDKNKKSTTADKEAPITKKDVEEQYEDR